MPYVNLTKGDISGQVIYYHNVQEILTPLSDAFEDEGVIVQLLCGDQMLTHSGGADIENVVMLNAPTAKVFEKLMIDGEEYYTACLDSVKFGLRLLISIPGSTLYAQCRERLRMPYMWRSLLIVLTVAIAAWTIFRNRRALMGISVHIEASDNLNLNGVEHTMRTMRTDRAHLSRMMEEQKQQLQEALFRQLIYGISGNETQMEVSTFSAPIGQSNISDEQAMFILSLESLAISFLHCYNESIYKCKGERP